ncbi:MAG: hypothetical protein NTW69_04715 [Chloroflexi bacterium]|nr:hypothetical protein [Chloroflexota bacterium]
MTFLVKCGNENKIKLGEVQGDAKRVAVRPLHPSDCYAIPQMRFDQEEIDY